MYTLLKCIWRCTRRILVPVLGRISVFIVLHWCIWIGIKVQYSVHSNRCVQTHIVQVHWRCTRRILVLVFGRISVFIVLQWCIMDWHLSIGWLHLFTCWSPHSSPIAGCFCWIGGRSKRASEDQACAVWPQEVAFLPNLCRSQPCTPWWQAHWAHRLLQSHCWCEFFSPTSLLLTPVKRLILFYFFLTTKLDVGIVV